MCYKKWKIGGSNGCVICRSATIETVMHLLFECPYATKVWRRISIMMSRTIFRMEQNLQDTWLGQVRGDRYADWKIYGPVLIVCGCWLIWKQRNEMIFRGRKLPPGKLAERIVQKAMLWRRQFQQKEMLYRLVLNAKMDVI